MTDEDRIAEAMRLVWEHVDWVACHVGDRGYPQGGAMPDSFDSTPEVVRTRAALEAHLRAALVETPTADAEFELHCDDEFAAGASGPREAAWRQICHYACQYAQDGPIKIFEVTRREVTAPQEGSQP